jgi:hypothetical protein
VGNYFYVLKHGEGTVWHFCTNCSHWPKEDEKALVLSMHQASYKPDTGVFCTECKALLEKGECAHDPKNDLPPTPLGI